MMKKRDKFRYKLSVCIDYVFRICPELGKIWEEFFDYHNKTLLVHFQFISLWIWFYHLCLFLFTLKKHACYVKITLCKVCSFKGKLNCLDSFNYICMYKLCRKYFCEHKRKPKKITFNALIKQHLLNPGYTVAILATSARMHSDD